MSKAAQSEASKKQAANLKAMGVCRTTGRCANCYRLIQIESWKSRYKHICR